MELRHLHYFIIVAEELHFGRAAVRLQMTQPPLSQQIKQLENEIGVDLFKRTKRHVELTTAGKMFLNDAKQALSVLDQAVDTAQRAQRGEIGHIAVGFVGSATYDILPDIVREFRRKFPDVSIELQELSTPDQIKALHDGYLDIGMVHPPINSSMITTEILLRGKCALSMPKNHPLAKKEAIYLKDLVDIPFIVVSRDIWPALYDDFVSLFQDAGFTPKIVQEANEYQMVLGLVSAGIGIGVVPSTAEKNFNLDVVYKEIEDYPLNAILSVAYRKTDENPSLKRFIDISKEIGQKYMID
ncbi:LysR family transcriptional regulator [Terrilactibacillus sp. BCM23-1]|uniref:LysR family transcriptional regulator n=1 Tax=Terrilactibacillus tamarindi TaxID=2599694 RepID=A0A6N8CLH9_9BACI|nr:LysR family transcriptional regulator [Terrilactibacillus tamarindi]MTT30779.1 LysR family transcriptional regulator [Terrilactibacillus tamarindi]